LTSATLLLVALLCVVLLLPVPYVSLQPGPTLDALGEQGGEPLISIKGDVRTYDDGGELDLVTVSVTNPDVDVRLPEALDAWFDPGAALVPKDLIYPGDVTTEESTAQTQQAMTGSQESARVAGLVAAGYPPVVRVAVVDREGPAVDRLRAGDVVLAVDGAPVETPVEVVDAITELSPGDRVDLRVRRSDSVRSVTVTTTASEEEPDVARIGVQVAQDVDADVEVVNNISRQIGGPSAGMIFALAIYDKLTAGALTGGVTVAGTGEITADGEVGPIGGIQQKVVGAADTGASIFLVPADNCAEVLDGEFDEDLRLVRVETLDDAIRSLETLAEDPSAEVATC
jgi:PDZ domain-containing protein